MYYWVIGLAGAIGALLRYGVELLFPVSNWGGFPMGTLWVNLLGCFLLSGFTVWSTIITALPIWLRTGITVGLIGSFTTFSTFSLETMQLWQSGLWEWALLYLLLSLWGGLLCTWGGYYLARKFMGKTKVGD